MDGIVSGNASNATHNSELDHLPPLQRQIMILVHSTPPTNEGVHVQHIAQQIQAPSSTVMQAVEQLATDGLLYTTIDDDHVTSDP